jgi:hypothetical protein
MLETVYDELDYPEAQHTILYILDEEDCTDEQVHMLAGVIRRPYRGRSSHSSVRYLSRPRCDFFMRCTTVSRDTGE